MYNSISEISILWQKALKKIEERLNEKQLFDSFFADSYIYEIQTDTIVIVCNSAVAVRLMEDKYLSIISDVIKELTEVKYDFKFIKSSDIDSLVSAPIEPQQKRGNYFQDSIINPNLTFDNFVVGDFNKEASKAASLIAANPGKMFNPLFIHSNSGLGKTHLLHSIGNYISKISMPGAKIIYINANDFIEEYLKFVRGEKDSQSIKDYVSNFDVLLFDDVQFLANKVKTEEVFFTIFQSMTNKGKQIVITSDRQPSELKGLEDRLVTRFSQGLSVQIDDPDQNTCVEILKKKIVSSGLDINSFDPSVLYFFAEKFSSNVRELEGALNKLIFYVMSYKETNFITLDVAAEAVQNIIGNSNVATQLSEQKIINIVADYYSLLPNQLTGKDRTGQVALARHIAMYLIRYSLDVPLKKIGSMFGGKDHTTVMNALEKVDKGLKTDEKLKQAIGELQKRIKA